MSDLGLMHYFHGIEVMQSNDGIFLSQEKYVGEILIKFQITDCNYVSTSVECGMKLHKDHDEKEVAITLYKQVVGSLMNLTTRRPYIIYYVSIISRYMENPTKLHLLATKRILHYLQGAGGLGIY